MKDSFALELCDKYNLSYRAVKNFLNKHKGLSKDEVIAHYEKYTETKEYLKAYEDEINYVCKEYGFTRNYVIEILREKPYKLKQEWQFDEYFRQAAEHRKLVKNFKELGLNRNTYRRYLEQYPDITLENLAEAVENIRGQEEANKKDKENFITECKSNGFKIATIQEFKRKNNIQYYSEAISEYKKYLDKKKNEQLCTKLEAIDVSYARYNKAARDNPDKSFEEIVAIIKEKDAEVSFRSYCIKNGYRNEYNRIKSWLVDKHEEFDGKTYDDIINAYNNRKDRLAKNKEYRKLAERLGISISTLRIFINSYKFNEETSIEDIEAAYKYYKQNRMDLGKLCKEYGVKYTVAKRIKAVHADLSNKDIVSLLCENKEIGVNLLGDLVNIEA